MFMKHTVAMWTKIARVMSFNLLAWSGLEVPGHPLALNDSFMNDTIALPQL